MGSTQSTVLGLTSEMLNEYLDLTYLSRNEIIELRKTFYTLGPNQLNSDFNFRFPVDKVADLYPALKHNPLRGRIFKVFSSEKDDCVSFEDMLDLYSVMSKNCPTKLKAQWAFKIFDFDGDNYVGEDDLIKAITELTQEEKQNHAIPDNDKRHIIKIVLTELDIQKTGNVGESEFVHGVSKISDFHHTFSFKI